MDIALLLICIIGILLFGVYIFAMVKTSMDDTKAKKLDEQMNKNEKD